LAIISSCGRFNLAFRVSDSAYQALRNEAKLALDSLMQATHGGRDVFESLFCTKLNFWCSYDHFFAVRLPALAAVEEKLLGADIERSICDLTWPHVVRDIAQELVTRGLVSTERAKLVRVCLPDVGQWKSSAAVPEPDHLVVCVTLDSDNALRLVDRGPDAADDKLCRDFRTLWGTRAELRRFQDGSIVESVVWTDENGKTDKPRIPFLVVNHLLTTHNPFCGPQGLAAPRDSVWTVQGPLEKYMTRVLSERFLPAWATSESSTGTDDAMSRFRSAIATFHDVDTHLRELNLPLDINAVEPADPALRYSSVVPPVAHPLAFGSKDKSKFTIAQQQRRGGGGRKRQRPGVPSSSSWVSRILRPMEVVVQLENSARWPDNIEAINHMKVAFYVQMAEQLEQRSRGMTRCQVGTDALDVMQSGFVFRVRIRHYREVDLLAGKVQAGSLALAATRTKLSARQLEVNRGEAFRLKQMTELRPVLHSKLHGLYLRAEVAQSMSTVVRLAKLWISGHHMSAHIEEHAIELLVSCLYVHSAPFEAPRSAACGFLRFLHLLATWSWADAPLVVDINGDLTAEDTTAISTAFFQHKDAGRACPMHLIVPENRASSWLPSWTTKTCPSAGALDRVVVSARDSLKLLSGLFDANCRGGIADDDVLWRAVFRSPVNKSSGFDAVVSLDPVALVGLTSSSPASTSSNGVGKTGDEWNVALYKNLAVAAEDSVLVGFDPLARYAQDLRHEFGSLAEFFYDGLQGQEIGVQWRKDAARPVALRVGSSMYAKKASVKDGDKEGEEKVVPNYAQITHTMREMGSGVVSDVQVWGVPTATTESPVSKRSKKRKIKTGDEKNRLSASNSNSKRTKSAL
jgi:U3 small nucleolar RNA-associated protein 22